MACRSSTSGQGLTFTSARVLARALFRASGYMTFGTPITSRPWTGGLSALSCLGELCNCNRTYDCRGDVWALSPANVRSHGPGTSRAGASRPGRSFELPLVKGFLPLQGGLSSAHGLSSLRPLPATLSLCLAARASRPGNGSVPLRVVLSLPPSAALVLCCEQCPSYHSFLSRELCF